MSEAFPPTWATLQYPWIRRELLLTLEELSVSDPRPIWRKETVEGFCAGVDQIVHFLFDDHDFDADDIGFSLFDESEVKALADLKLALGALIDKLPKGGDDDYVADPAWPNVTKAAHTALARMRSA